MFFFRANFEFLACARDFRYPVIISIENHCGMKQQRVMAQKFIEIFGSALITEPLFENETRLPAPEQLKRRIILKGRKLNSASAFNPFKSSNENLNVQVSDDSMENMRKTGKLYLQNNSNDDANLSCNSWEPYFFALSDNKLLYTEVADKENDEVSSCGRNREGIRGGRSTWYEDGEEKVSIL